MRTEEYACIVYPCIYLYTSAWDYNEEIYESEEFL